jgi:hypothetical protein
VSLTNGTILSADNTNIGSGGTIHVEAHKVTLTDSQILSTATEGQGGTIDITSHALQQDANSVIDASSQFGTDGTVTINGIIQP